MEEAQRIKVYYKWLRAIIQDDIEPLKTLTSTLSTINPQERISFLGYLLCEYKEGVVEELLELRFEYDTASNKDGYEEAEFAGLSPSDVSYLLMCRSADALQSLFSDYVPALSKRLKKLFGSSSAIESPVEHEAVYDEKEEYLTTPQAMALLGVEADTIRHYVSRGVKGMKLPCIKIGKNNKYKKSDLLKLYRPGSYRNEELEREFQMEKERLKKQK
ncbi:helix-turn-helix domain-containing protein [Pontibacter akesuensis]|uniref:Helix-turn-helix domain-containing protein n=1 Tax=Pontibacter akesuensis TaxID=388950 RepID=A0A1I7IMC6_9BACT|nr:helix-turn-helix domain-containing protein [Pontibacter akesuensis]GHA67851.1 hypothetical protein GCM10007389_21490 [Pontibacter akesuensis]SFU74067.1 Helix-turn-helix domain-containing protein [Pontibacter akesuensis]